MAKKSQIDIAIERVQAEIDILEAVMAWLEGDFHYGLRSHALRRLL